MNQRRRPPELDMTVDGEFVSPPTTPIAGRILVWAIAIAAIAGTLFIAAFALWLALAILPVALGAAIVAWGIFRYRTWRMQRAFSGQQNVWRP